MSEGLIVSAIINLLVAFYMIYIFPRNLQKKLPQMPPFFKFLHRAIPILGKIIIIMTLLLIAWELLQQEPLL
jgi:O-antigen/teichoic acid export membrane protein